MVVEACKNGLQDLPEKYIRQFKKETEKFTAVQVKDENKKRYFVSKCQFSKWKKEDLKHWIDYFEACTSAEIYKIKTDMKLSKAPDSPWKNTPSKKAYGNFGYIPPEKVSMIVDQAIFRWRLERFPYRML